MNFEMAKMGLHKHFHTYNIYVTTVGDQNPSFYKKIQPSIAQ